MKRFLLFSPLLLLLLLLVGGGTSSVVAKADPPKPESTEGGRLVSILKWPEGAPLNLG